MPQPVGGSRFRAAVRKFRVPLGGCPRKLASSFRKLRAAFQAGQANEERAGEFSGSNFQLLGNSLTALQYCQQLPRRRFNATLISIWSPALKAVNRGVRASANFPHAFLAFRIFESRLMGRLSVARLFFLRGFAIGFRWRNAVPGRERDIFFQKPRPVTLEKTFRFQVFFC